MNHTTVLERVDGVDVARRCALDEPAAKRSIRRRRWRIGLLVAATVLSAPTILLPLVFGGWAVVDASRLRRIRGVLRRNRWRAVELESDAPLFDVIARDWGWTRWRQPQFRSPRRFTGQVAGPTRASVLGGGYSVVREPGSDQIHLVRGCVGAEVHHRPAALVDDIALLLPAEVAPVRCGLSPRGLEALDQPVAWLTVLATKNTIWDSTGEQIGRLGRDGFDITLRDSEGSFIIGRDRRFRDDVFWSDAGDRGTASRRVVRLTQVTLRSKGWRWPRLRSDDGTVLAITTRTPLDRWWSRSAAISVSSELDPVDRAAVVLHLAVAVGLAPNHSPSRV